MNSTDCYNKILEGLGLKPRAGQEKVISTVGQGLESGISRTFCTEAGTGTGKSLALLCATVPYAKENNLKVIISTGTIQLQKQLLDKDLPDFLEHSELGVRAKLAKGRSRYLCPRKLTNKLQTSANQEFIELAENFNNESWSGELDDIQKPKEWESICANRFDCSGVQCSHASQCPFIRARKELKEADIIVSNHDLTLADLAMGGLILSEPDKSIYVFDEAHHLSEKAINQFSFSYTTSEGADWAGKMHEFIGKNADLLEKHSSGFTQKVEGNLDSYLENINILEHLMADIRFDEKQHKDQPYLQKRFEHGKLPENIRNVAQACRAQWRVLHEAVDNMTSNLKKAAKDGDDEIVNVLEQSGDLVSKSERAQSLWLGFAHQDGNGQIPRARWAISNPNGSFTLHCAAINASRALNTFLFSKAYACVLASATISVDQSFENFKKQIGLPDDTVFLSVDSPFDYQSAGTLKVPNTTIDPKQTAKHTDFIRSYVSNEIDLNEGTLVIFASYKQMNDVYSELPEHIADFILKQGSTSKAKILEEHKSRIDGGQGSIIFGLQQSWGEGVDLPGKYATNVVISKLSFAVPDDPISEAKSEWVSAIGGNPFMDVSVPDATLKLVQSVGRLIRTEKDTGNVTILDNRIIKKRYGKMMMNSLPPLRLVK